MNKAIIALTDGGHPDMAVDMAKAMRIAGHHTDRSTLDFVEKSLYEACNAAEAWKPADAALEEARREKEEEGGRAAPRLSGGGRDDLGQDLSLTERSGDVGNCVVDESLGRPSVNLKNGEGAGPSFARGGQAEYGAIGEEQEGKGARLAAEPEVPRPSALDLRFLPLLTQALRAMLRAEDTTQADFKKFADAEAVLLRAKARNMRKLDSRGRGPGEIANNTSGAMGNAVEGVDRLIHYWRTVSGDQVCRFL